MCMNAYIRKLSVFIISQNYVVYSQLVYLYICNIYIYIYVITSKNLEVGSIKAASVSCCSESNTSG